jgi:hypothetical protein
MRLIERRNVVFPQPDGPINAVTVFSRMAMVTSCTARNEP